MELGPVRGGIRVEGSLFLAQFVQNIGYHPSLAFAVKGIPEPIGRLHSARRLLEKREYFLIRLQF